MREIGDAEIMLSFLKNGTIYGYCTPRLKNYDCEGIQEIVEEYRLEMKVMVRRYL